MVWNDSTRHSSEVREVTTVGSGFLCPFHLCLYLFQFLALRPFHLCLYLFKFLAHNEVAIYYLDVVLLGQLHI